jgi:DNA-binding CsgD family transcriptional regulator
MNSARADGELALEIARGRRDPAFFIVNEDAEMVAAPSARAAMPWAQTYSLAMEETVRRLTREHPDERSFALLDEGTVVRVVPIVANQPHFVVFLERHEPRNLLRSAAHVYGLTAREIELLRLLLQGDSTREISESLCISELTVHQHVKNIGRKMGVSKRMEIVGQLLGAR